MPAEGITTEGGITFFAVDVVPADDSTPWRVMRRYNHFREVARQLAASEDGCRNLWNTFPGKRLGCSGLALERRRRRLEMWLSELVVQQDYVKPLSVQRFLQKGRMPIPNASIQTQAPPQEEVNSATPLMFVQVQLPPDVGAYQDVIVKVPHGGDITITVPWGIAPGSLMSLWHDPVAGTLGVQHSQDWQALRGVQQYLVQLGEC